MRSEYTRNNMKATRPPTVNDDSTQGWTEDSRWLDTVSGKTYMCIDAQHGKAVWIPFPACQCDIGSWSGDSSNNRQIVAGFFPDYLLIHCCVGTNVVLIHYWKDKQNNAGTPLLYDTGAGLGVGLFRDPVGAELQLVLNSTGFLVGIGTGNWFNKTGHTYYYTAMKSS